MPLSDFLVLSDDWALAALDEITSTREDSNRRATRRVQSDVETMDRAAEERTREADEQDQRILNGDARDVNQVRAEAENNRDAADDLTTQADVDRGNAGDAFDSAERRAQLAASLEGKVDPAVLDARLTAAADQARHSREAVTTGPKRAPKARRASVGQGQQRSVTWAADGALFPAWQPGAVYSRRNGQSDGGRALGC